MSRLIICEKPSVAKTVAAALGAKEKKDGYIAGDNILVSWCIGHLVSMSDAGSYDERYKKWQYEDLPILPEEWKYHLIPGKETQFGILKELMHHEDVEELVNACDAGREGELIFRFVYEQAGCKKPFKRLWISSMEDSAIRDGFANLRDGKEYDPLYYSALCRARADWIVGINATRLFSVLYHRTLNVGRVLSPTLNLLVERDSKISNFKKEKYHTVNIRCGGANATSRKISEAEETEKLKKSCEASQAVCVSVTKEKKTQAPPKLFDLTALQREANRIYGFTAKQTLDYAQGLYEKRLLTYPRTDSNFLTADMEQSTTDLVAAIMPLLTFTQDMELTPDVGRVLNNDKVSDHHAILPTMELVKKGFDGLTESEKKLLSLVCCKLLCAVAPPHLYEAVTAIFECSGEQFTAKGKTVIENGWKAVEIRFRSTLKGKSDEDIEDETTLPELTEGQTFDNPAVDLSEHYTTPPKPYTEDTLLSAMESAGKEDMPEEAERKGLGTPATRAAMIEKLLSSGFVERTGKSLVPTKDGINLTTILPDTLKSPLLTAEWESKLTEIAQGKADPDEFMSGIADMTMELVNSYSHITEDGEKMFAPEREAIGNCPRCGKPVYEGKKNYYCSDRSCRFVMWKNDRFFEERKVAFTPKIAAALLKSGKAKVKGLYSPKTGKTYDGTVLLADTGEKYVNYRIEVTKK